MKNPLNHLIGYWVDHQLKWMKALVVDGELRARRRLFRRMLARYAVVVAGMALMNFAGDMTLGQLIGYTILMLGALGWTTRQAYGAESYRSGWLAGRTHMVHGMAEHEDPRKWLESMLIHDGVHVLGMSVPTPDSPEGLTSD